MNPTELLKKKDLQIENLKIEIKSRNQEIKRLNAIINEQNDRIKRYDKRIDAHFSYIDLIEKDNARLKAEINRLNNNIFKLPKKENTVPDQKDTKISGKVIRFHSM